MIKNTDRAYAAGYFDGDGCFHLSKHRKKFISSIIIVSTDKNILIWFKSLWGGAISSAKKIPDQKIVHRLAINKRKSVYFSQKIHYFLIEKFFEANVYQGFIATDDNTKKMNLIDELKHIKNNTNLVSREMKQSFENNIKTIIPTEEDYAYLAGFIDAECCFGIQKNFVKNKPNPTYKIYLSCNNTKAPVFKWLLERFGGRINFIDRATKNPKHRNQFSWRVSGRMLQPILSNVLPFLKYKKPVCKELMKFYDTTLVNGGARHTETFRNSYAAILKERASIVHKVHLLNLKGTR